MTKFKIGDVITANAHQNKNSPWSGPLTVYYVDTRTICGENMEGHRGGFPIDEVTLFNPPKTDEELAAEYREIRQKCHDKLNELKDRGYQVNGAVGEKTGIKIYKDEEAFELVEVKKIVRKAI